MTFAPSPRISVNADFSTLKCLASCKKSVEQPCPSMPRQTSALELLVFYCFHILLVYPCALYYGMLICHVRMEHVLLPLRLSSELAFQVPTHTYILTQLHIHTHTHTHTHTRTHTHAHTHTHTHTHTHAHTHTHTHAHTHM